MVFLDLSHAKVTPLKDIPLKHRLRKNLIRVLVTGDTDDGKTVQSLIDRGWVAKVKKSGRNTYAVTNEGNSVLDADLKFHRTGKPN